MEGIESYGQEAFADVERFAMRAAADEEMIRFESLFYERVAIMMHDAGLSECAAIRKAYSDTRSQLPGIPVPYKIRFMIDKCMDLK